MRFEGSVFADAIDYSFDAMSETYLLTNISPQMACLNRSGWRVLESHVRHWAEGRREIFVVTGASYQDDSEIGNGVAVPSAFLKVLYEPKAQTNTVYFIRHDCFKW